MTGLPNAIVLVDETMLMRWNVEALMPQQTVDFCLALFVICIQIPSDETMKTVLVE